MKRAQPATSLHRRLLREGASAQTDPGTTSTLARAAARRVAASVTGRSIGGTRPLMTGQAGVCRRCGLGHTKGRCPEEPASAAVECPHCGALVASASGLEEHAGRWHRSWRGQTNTARRERGPDEPPRKGGPFVSGGRPESSRRRH